MTSGGGSCLGALARAPLGLHGAHGDWWSLLRAARRGRQSRLAPTGSASQAATATRHRGRVTSTTHRRSDRPFGLQPHRQDTFKLSKDPLFIEKVHDVVGLYLDPPERAVVLCVDEKSQIQALDRTAPILPMLPGTPQRATHDYKRAGTSSLYAALDLTTGR